MADTTHISTIEMGAYMLLLVAMWRNKGTLPNDDKLLARYARLTKTQWGRVKPIIWPCFKVTPETISQGRLTDELTAVRRRNTKQSNNAKARWLKNKETTDATAMPSQSQTDASLNLNPSPSSSVSPDGDTAAVAPEAPSGNGQGGKGSAPPAPPPEPEDDGNITRMPDPLHDTKTRPSGRAWRF